MFNEPTFRFYVEWFSIIDTLSDKKKKELYKELRDYVCFILDEGTDDKLSLDAFAAQIKDDAVRVAFVAIAQNIDINE